MLFNIGIEAASDGSAFGIIAPVFDKHGYGCTTAADNEGDIAHQAIDAVLLMIEEVIADGVDLESLNEGYIDYSECADYSDFKRWLVIDIDISKPKRTYINLSDTLLNRIDSFVEANQEYRDRSHLLAVAAQNEMSQHQKP